MDARNQPEITVVERRFVHEAFIQAALMKAARSVLAAKQVHTVSTTDLEKLAKLIQIELFTGGVVCMKLENLVSPDYMKNHFDKQEYQHG